MPDYIGNIEVPQIVPSGVFPLTPDFPHDHAQEPHVVVHQFGSANSKVEQRFYQGPGAKRFFIRKSFLKDADRIALRDFWEDHYGSYGSFYYDAPNDDGQGTTRYTCRFANEPLTWEMVSDVVCSVGLTLIEIPSNSPTYTLNQTLTRFPSAALEDALLSQVQEVIPLIKIQPLHPGYPTIHLSDRRCTIGGQLYLPRLLDFDGISQSLGNAADEARLTFGNADRVMRDLANDVDLFRASIEFSLFHVGTDIKLDLWKGDIVDWSADSGPEFRVTAADGLYELNLPYPTRRISRTCWKDLDSPACPASTAGGTNLVTPCDKGFDTPRGCRFHNMADHFGGVIAKPQAVRIKDNSTGTWGFGRSSITSVSLVADSIYDQVVPEIYTDSPLPVNCKVAAGREESEFYNALGIVGEGPLGAFGTGHKLDGQPHHGPNTLGLRTSLGADPNTDPFSLGQGSPTVYGPERAAGTAFLEIRRTDAKGFQPSRLAEHEMQAVVAQGLSGWVWSASGVRSQQVLTNPIWIIVNMLLRARGLRFADATTCEQYFDVNAAIAAAAICDEQASKLVGSGNETQFKFRGVLQEEKPLRDWIQEILMNCLGYYSFACGKLKLGIRVNSSAVENFTIGNILFQSLQLSTARPAFNHLSANFADEEFDFVANSVSVYDIDHAKLVGGATSPLYLKSNVNLSGTSSKSQAARLISVRLREELGGITPEEWRKARHVAFRTTVLALNVEPGMVCSMTHPDMPDGHGEFRVTGWRLNKDYSIDIEGRTTTDSMYDLAIGPKPADVIADPVPEEPYDQPAPNVVLFKVGRSNGDGTFTPEMYWDDRRQRMLIDWACMLPADRMNWRGVQIWIKTPDGQGGFDYTQATGIFEAESFREAEDGSFYYYDTIAIEPESVPETEETWTVIAASVDRFGNLNIDANGDPTRVGLDLQTLTVSDYVQIFTVTVVREYTEGGDQMFRLTGSWTNPDVPRYKGVRVIMRGWDAEDIPLTDEFEGATSFQSDAWPVPEAPKTVDIYAVPIYGDETVGTIVEGTTPTFQVTIGRLDGTPGREYAEIVTGLSAAVASPAYATNGQGQKVLRVDVSWSKPNDVRFGGAVIFMVRGGVAYQITGVETGTSKRLELTNFPGSNESVAVYVLSVDTNNRMNSYVQFTTPEISLTLPPPQAGAAGSEWTSNVTGFSASVSYPATADGTHKAIVTVSFSPPNDPTWGGIEIRTWGGSGYQTRVKAGTSPVTFELPASAFSQAFSVYGVSFDVNGKANTIVGGVTPRQDIIVGTSAGELDLSKAKATTYDPNIFTIQNGAFKVWAMDGSLIVTGSIASSKLNATEISVGGGGGKPGKFGVYNASGQQIGFIGVEGANQGGWFKTLAVGGNDSSSAYLKADSSGIVTLTGAKVSVTGTYTEGSGYSTTCEMNPAGSLIPFRVYSANGECWMEDGEVAVVSNYSYNRYPLGRMYRTSSRAAMELWSGVQSSDGRLFCYAESSLVQFDLGILSLDRRLLVNIDTGSDPYVDFRNIAIKADGYAGQSVALGYKKDDGTNGTLKFRRGLLTSYS
jgi:hypothetical protein